MGSAQSRFKKAYIHLLDGGIADNLGVSEPYRMLTQQGMAAPLFNMISTGTIKRILFVMINARSAASSDLDKKPDTPGIIDMLEGTTGAAIDRATVGAAQRLRALLQHSFEDEAEYLKAQGRANAVNFQTVADNTFLVSVDFDAIADATCRQRFHNIGTNWGMKDKEVDAILDVGEALTTGDPQFKKAASVLGATVDPGLPDLNKACSEVPHNENDSAALRLQRHPVAVIGDDELGIHVAELDDNRLRVRIDAHLRRHARCAACMPVIVREPLAMHLEAVTVPVAFGFGTGRGVPQIVRQKLSVPSLHART
ncbi:MAG: hypothetical protein WDM89_13540 [Rhizomicrobium sp.]